MATTRSVLVLLVLVAVAVGAVVGLLVGLLQLSASAT
jgi:type III secretory pathway component EscS